MVSKVDVWAGPRCLNGIKVTLSCGHVSSKGTTEGRHDGLTIPPGVKVTNLTLWGNGVGTRCGGIWIKLSNGSELMQSLWKWGLKRGYEINVGSGIPVAVYGKSGAEIDRLAFAFLKPIKSCKTMDVEINLSEADAASPVVFRRSYSNHTSVPQRAEFKFSETFRITRSCTRSTGVEESTNASISLGPPECQIGGGVSTTHRVTLSDTRSETTAKTFEDKIDVAVPAHQTVHAEFRCMKATYDAPYTATVHTKFKDGTEWTVTTNGRYKGTSVSQGTTSFKYERLV